MSRIACVEILSALPLGCSIKEARAVRVGHRFGVQVTTEISGKQRRTTRVYPPFVPTASAARQIASDLVETSRAWR